MAILRAPGLGPIVGHTTDKCCRIWARAGDPGDTRSLLDENRRTVGVIGLVTKPGEIGPAWYFRLHREYDRTGTFVVGEDVQLGYFEDDFKAQGRSVPRKNPPKEAVPASLSPDTEYTVRVGTLTIDDPMPNDQSLQDWELVRRLPDIDDIKQELCLLEAEECESKFRTFPKADPKKVESSMGFLLGSCRYPGLLWKIKEADRIFRPMLEHFQPDNGFGSPVQFTMMCGDQVYADLLNKALPVGRADTYEEFQERYLTAYRGTNLRRLMRLATTYMILDDHEIEDNWTQDQLHDTGKHQLFNVAIGAYQSYQWSHGPRTFGRLLYYTFECAGYPVFVIDTRTQRYKDDLPGLRDNHLLGRPSLDPKNHPGQLQRLCDWLSQQQKDRGNVPKFIATASVFVPNAMDERIAPPGHSLFGGPDPNEGQIDDPFRKMFEVNRERRENSDSWPAYPVTRLELLKHIVDNDIQNVVFLSGDIHCSNVAEIYFEGKDGKDLKAASVTSSAFYWPFPFADGDPNGFVHDSTQPNQLDPFPVLGTDAVMQYRSFGYSQEDNFARVDIDRAAATLTVRVFDRDGNIVEVDDLKGRMVKKNVIQLASW
jgi:alkaline phosphatase D